MQRSSVSIAGVGAVSSAGWDVASTVESFGIARRNIAAGLPFDSSITCPTFQVAAELPILSAPVSRSRSLRLGMKAVGEAMADAQIDGFDPQTRVGVCIGTTVASQLNSIPFYDAYRRDPAHPGLDAVNDYLRANLAQAIGQLLGATGPRMTIVNACSSGTDAIGVAATWIRGGLCDLAVAGGADELNRVALAGFWSLGVMSSQPCAPFDRDRAGLNLGEGAGILLLESSSHAKKRGKKCAFEVAGFGGACDAHHLTAPHPDGRGLDLAIRTALSQANVAPDGSHSSTPTERRQRTTTGPREKSSPAFSNPSFPSYRPRDTPATRWAPPAGWKRCSRCWACARDGFPLARDLKTRQTIFRSRRFAGARPSVATAPCQPRWLSAGTTRRW